MISSILEPIAFAGTTPSPSPPLLSLPHFFIPPLPHSLTPSLPHSLTPSLPHSLTPSLTCPPPRPPPRASIAKEGKSRKYPHLFVELLGVLFNTYKPECFFFDIINFYHVRIFIDISHACCASRQTHHINHTHLPLTARL